MTLIASPHLQTYFSQIKKDCFIAYDIAKKARAQGYDPDTDVEVSLAETLAERVVGLISVIAPQIKGSGVVERILELEQQYNILDWRVGMVIAYEIAQQKYCKFKSALEAIEVGVRVGFAYVTLGVVSSPIEGLTSIEIKPRLDGKGEFFRINYAGPIRNAGGTAAAVSVLIADYVRKKMGYAKYDPTEKELQRCPSELEDYHNYIANLQYWPSKEESIFLMQHIPVEIAGDASEKREVSNVNMKDIPRIETNNLRSGYCLIHSSCIPLKGPKLWKKLSEWGKEMEMEDWNFLKEYLVLQKKMKAKGKKEEGAKISPDYTYIKDIVAGRPVLAHPLQVGGFRLRYGRSRASGYSGQSIHPASMVVLDDFVATGTQLKVERPGKAAAFTPCDTVDGPIVKLFDGRVLRLTTEEHARKHAKNVAEILFLGDVLINYGDFFDRAHTLVPPGYTPEFWILEVNKAIEEQDYNISLLANKAGMTEEEFIIMQKNPLTTFPTFTQAHAISKALGVPLHPQHTQYLTTLKPAEHIIIIDWLARADFTANKLILPYAQGEGKKRLLELAGVPHTLSTENIILEGDVAQSILHTYGFNGEPFSREKHKEIRAAYEGSEAKDQDGVLALINITSTVRQRDKAGIFIGSRMGRPEKAKMRKLTGSPHTLFPIGEQGGRLRSFQAALEAGYVKSSYPINVCVACDIKTPLFRCELCDAPTQRLKHCKTCGDVEDCSHEPWVFKEWDVPIKRLFDGALKKLNMKTYPDLIKGVRGTSNKSHIPEHLAKGILRAKHSVHVNKDGTIRYDASEITLTHFKPKEVAVSVKRLKELGYLYDMKGDKLENDDQVLELKPQDVVIPCCTAPGYPDEKADEVLFRVTQFIDDLLTLWYGLPAYYQLKSPADLVGHYIIGLAPHTSAGIVGRIIGMSKTQGFLAHPLMHAAMRRDCDGDESCFLLLMDTFLNFSKKYLPESRGGTMDAPLVLTYWLNPAEVDDMAFNVDTEWDYPLEFYEAALAYKKPWDVPLKRIEHYLGTPQQFEGMGYTHGTDDINAGVLCSAYKILPSMGEKLEGQLTLAKKIRACDASDVARLVITKHFMRDTKGNLRKFSQQQYRCVNCNEKYRRPPLRGTCKACNGGKIIFTISEGSVVKYLEPSIRIAEEYNVPTYLKQDLELTKRRVEENFGKDAERQEGLTKFFS